MQKLRNLNSRDARIAWWVGLLLGAAAATVGVTSPFASFPLRPWHALVLIAFVIGIGSAIKPARSRPSIGVRVFALDICLVLFISTNLFLEFVNSTQLGFALEFGEVIDRIFWLMTYVASRSVIKCVNAGAAFVRSFLSPIFLLLPLSVAQVLDFGPINTLTTSIVTSDGFASRLEDGQLLRAVGLVGHWTSFGSYLTVIFAGAIALLIISRQTPYQTSVYAVTVLAMTSITLLTTLTFAPMLISGAILLLSAPRTKHASKLLLVLGLASVLGWLLLGTAIQERILQQTEGPIGRLDWMPDWVPNTLRYRVLIWLTETVPMIAARPSTGWGNEVYSLVLSGGDATREYPHQLRWLSPESQWLGTAMTDGLIGLSALIVLLVAMISMLRRGVQLESARWLATPMFWLVACTLIAAATAPMFTNKGLPLGLWSFLGVVAAFVASQKATRDPHLAHHLGRISTTNSGASKP